MDSTPPTVQSTKPGGSAAPKSVFVIVFSEKVKGVSDKTVKLYRKGKTFMVNIRYSKIKDQAGNALVKPKKWQVTVK